MFNVKVIGSNMTEVRCEKGIILVSYETPVAACLNGQYIRTAKKWSNTTTRHINKWLEGMQAKTVEQSVLDGLL